MKRLSTFCLVAVVVIFFLGIATINQKVQALEERGGYQTLVSLGIIVPCESDEEYDEWENYIPELEPEPEHESVSEPELETHPEPYNPRAEGTELWWLAHLIRGEADTECIEDMRGVAIVAMNRVANSSYPDTIAEVVQDKKFGTQYACYWDTDSQFYKEPTEECWEIAQQVLDGERWDWPENVIYQAQFKQGSGVFKVVKTRFGTHYYCYE